MWGEGWRLAPLGLQEGPLGWIWLEVPAPRCVSDPAQKSSFPNAETQLLSGARAGCHPTATCGLYPGRGTCPQPGKMMIKSVGRGGREARRPGPGREGEPCAEEGVDRVPPQLVQEELGTKPVQG